MEVRYQAIGVSAPHRDEYGGYSLTALGPKRVSHFKALADAKQSAKEIARDAKAHSKNPYLWKSRDTSFDPRIVMQIFIAVDNDELEEINASLSESQTCIRR